MFEVKRNGLKEICCKPDDWPIIKQCAVMDPNLENPSTTFYKDKTVSAEASYEPETADTLFTVRWQDELLLGATCGTGHKGSFLVFKTEARARRALSIIDDLDKKGTGRGKGRERRRGRENGIGKKTNLKIEQYAWEDLETMGQLCRRSIEIDPDESILQKAEFF